MDSLDIKRPHIPGSKATYFGYIRKRDKYKSLDFCHYEKLSAGSFHIISGVSLKGISQGRGAVDFKWHEYNVEHSKDSSHQVEKIPRTGYPSRIAVKTRKLSGEANEDDNIG